MIFYARITLVLAGIAAVVLSGSEALAREIHVAKTGSDSNSGGIQRPYSLNISGGWLLYGQWHHRGADGNDWPSEWNRAYVAVGGVVACEIRKALAANVLTTDQLSGRAVLSRARQSD